MTGAKIVQVPVDVAAAYRHIAVAVRMFGDSELDSLSNEARYTLAYDAARNAIAAVLRASGKRVTVGARAHVVMFVAARSLLGAEHIDAVRRLDDMRRIRHEIEYDTRDVSRAEVDAMRTPAQAIIDAATRYVDAVARA